MRKIKYDTICDGILIILTMKDVENDVEILMADFRDSYGLFHVETKNWVGINNTNHIKLCSGNPELKDGIWIIKENNFKNLININVSPTNTILKELL
ncbi:MAG TPA: hypothetical protein ENI61_06535 [Ignavibacteria bacterium]|nr:hypothetical protein [Ignavibacteria bacterium]